MQCRRAADLAEMVRLLVAVDDVSRRAFNPTGKLWQR